MCGSLSTAAHVKVYCRGMPQKMWTFSYILNMPKPISGKMHINNVGSGIQALDLEKEAYPALDELTSKISTLNLERVRQIKSRLVAISGRVQKVPSVSYI